MPAHSTEFRMCRYCGQRIVTGYNRAGRTEAAGAYCSQGCAEIANPTSGAAEVAADTDAKRRLAAEVDARLPAIIMWLADGETVEQVASRLQLTKGRITQLVKRLQAKALSVRC